MELESRLDWNQQSQLGSGMRAKCGDNETTLEI